MGRIVTLESRGFKRNGILVQARRPCRENYRTMDAIDMDRPKIVLIY